MELLQNTCHPEWQDLLKGYFKCGQYYALSKFLIQEYSQEYCVPVEQDIFRGYSTAISHFRAIFVVANTFKSRLYADGLGYSCRNNVKYYPMATMQLLRELYNSNVSHKIVNADLLSLVKAGIYIHTLNPTTREHNYTPHSCWETHNKAVLTRLLTELGSSNVLLFCFGEYAYGWCKAYIKGCSPLLVTGAGLPTNSSKPSESSIYNMGIFDKINDHMRRLGDELIITI